MSHELRTPLASIKTAIDIVVSETPGALNLEQKDFLNKAEKHINRLNRLINDILDFSKLESNAVQLDLKENSIGAVIKDIVDINRLVAEKKGLYLKVESSGDAPQFMFDFDRLYQVMQNLVGNAIKFTEKGGIVVSIVCNEPLNYVKVCIADTGVGIRAEDFPKLFQRFQQLGDPAKRQFGGTGLGLAICKKIIEQHDGKIEVESQPGQRTKIFFTLPLQERRRRETNE
jgi:signal transduction histidine kinase